MQAISGYPLNRANLSAVRVQDGHQAAVYQCTVHFHRTGTAFTLSATLFRARETKLLAQHVQKPGHGISLKRYSATIHSATHTDFATGVTPEHRQRSPSAFPA